MMMITDLHKQPDPHRVTDFCLVKANGEYVAKELTESEANDIIEAVNFHRANHPEPGAVPSKRSVYVRECQAEQWYFWPSEQVWGQYCGVWDGNYRFYSDSNAEKFFSLTGLASVNPIASADEIEGEKLKDAEPKRYISCPSCGKGILDWHSDNPEHPYAVCRHCEARLALVPEVIEKLKPNECTVADLGVGEKCLVPTEWEKIMTVTPQQSIGRPYVILGRDTDNGDEEQCACPLETPCRRLPREDKS